MIIDCDASKCRCRRFNVLGDTAASKENAKEVQTNTTLSEDLLVWKNRSNRKSNGFCNLHCSSSSIQHRISFAIPKTHRKSLASLATVCCVTINQQQCSVRPIEARLLFSSTIKWARPFTASLTLPLMGPGTWPWQWPRLQVKDFDFWMDAYAPQGTWLENCEQKHWWLILVNIFS